MRQIWLLARPKIARDTTVWLQYHLWYVVCGYACPLDHLYKTCSVKHFALPNLTFKAFRVDQHLVLVHPTCIKVSMRKAPGPGIWPYQAWASHKPPPLTDTLDGMLFLQPPKTTYQKYAFFGMLLKKPKYSFYLVKAIFSLESLKTNLQATNLDQNLVFQRLSLEKWSFYHVKASFLTLEFRFQCWNLQISSQNCKNEAFTR